MLHRKEPATGRTTSVLQFRELASAHVGLIADDHIAIGERFLRPAEVDALRGNASKAFEKLGWAADTTLEQLVAKMVDADLEHHKSQEHL